MEQYNKEKKKILTLLGVGVVLLILFLFYANSHATRGHLSIRDFTDFESVIVMVAIICYPMGIVYGGRDMLNVYTRMRSRDTVIRYGYGNLFISMMWFAITAALVVCFGWLIGTYKALKGLYTLKKQIN